MKIEKALKTEDVAKLYQTIASLKTPQEVENFFRDLCTVKEISSMAERLKVASCLLRKESYRAIAKKTGISTATITRVAHWVHHGTGGYLSVLGRKS